MLVNKNNWDVLESFDKIDLKDVRRYFYKNLDDFPKRALEKIKHKFRKSVEKILMLNMMKPK